jgi:hypothetical protein
LNISLSLRVRVGGREEIKASDFIPLFPSFSLREKGRSVYFMVFIHDGI